VLSLIRFPHKGCATLRSLCFFLGDSKINAQKRGLGKNKVISGKAGKSGKVKSRKQELQSAYLRARTKRKTVPGKKK